jgi:hypothetical protein
MLRRSFLVDNKESRAKRDNKCAEFKPPPPASFGGKAFAGGPEKAPAAGASFRPFPHA